LLALTNRDHPCGEIYEIDAESACRWAESAEQHHDHTTKINCILEKHKGGQAVDVGAASSRGSGLHRIGRPRKNSPGEKWEDAKAGGRSLETKQGTFKGGYKLSGQRIGMKILHPTDATGGLPPLRDRNHTERCDNRNHRWDRRVNPVEKQSGEKAIKH